MAEMSRRKRKRTRALAAGQRRARVWRGITLAASEALAARGADPLAAHPTPGLAWSGRKQEDLEHPAVEVEADAGLAVHELKTRSSWRR
jgi:hypothetical protein